MLGTYFLYHDRSYQLVQGSALILAQSVCQRGRRVWSEFSLWLAGKLAKFCDLQAEAICESLENALTRSLGMFALEVVGERSTVYGVPAGFRSSNNNVQAISALGFVESVGKRGHRHKSFR